MFIVAAVNYVVIVQRSDAAELGICCDKQRVTVADAMMMGDINRSYINSQTNVPNTRPA
jgi:hypothetical protein